MIIEGYEIQGIERFVSRLGLRWKINFSLNFKDFISLCNSDAQRKEHSLIISYVEWSFDAGNVMTKLFSRAFLAEKIEPIFAGFKVKEPVELPDGKCLAWIVNSVSEVWVGDVRDNQWPDIAEKNKNFFPDSPLGNLILKKSSSLIPFPLFLSATSLIAGWKRFFGKSPLSLNEDSEGKAQTLTKIFEDLPRLEFDLVKDWKIFLAAVQEILWALEIPMKVSLVKHRNELKWGIDYP